MRKFLQGLLLIIVSLNTFSQGSETFTNIPTATASSYLTRNWIGDNGRQWVASDARTDQTINTQAIGLRIGSVSCTGIPNGIGTLQFAYKYLFTAGGDARIVVRINGDSITQIVVPTTATTNQVSPVFTVNVSGNFNLELVQANPASSSGPRAAIDDITWTSFSNTPCTTPAAQPTGLGFSGITTSNINGSFTAAAPAANKYLVLISTSATLTEQPTNGTNYSEDDAIGNATVASNDATTTFSEPGLKSSTAYYFFIYAYNDLCSGGPLYRLSSPLTGSATTVAPPVCVAPTAQITGINFGGITNSSISGAFTAAADADSYLILVSTNATLGFVPVNGVTYAEGQILGNGRVIKNGTGTTFLASGLVANTKYYLYFFPLNNANCTGGPLYNTTGLSATATTTNSNNNIPTGYYATITNQTCAALKTELKNIITNGMTPRSYSSLPDQYAVTDIKPREVGSGSANVIWDIYSDKPGANNDPYNFSTSQNSCGSGEGSGWNREHSVPQSWFTGGTATGPGTDYNHILPTDCSVNSARGSFIYGEVAAANFTSLNGSKRGSSAIAGFTGDVFEPINEYKGDVARAFLYFVTRYENNMPGWSGGTNGGQAMDPTTYPSIDVPYLRLMLKWHAQDPVSQKEIVRNNGAYDFQRNRNPYIDFPEYADLVWNSSCPGLGTLPVDLLWFSGKLNGNKIDLTWDVANEVNLRGYIVERSTNGKDFAKLNDLSASGRKTYTYSDDISQLSGRRLYYRIRLAEKDGSFKYSSIFSLHTPANNMFTLYPNPVSSGKLTIQLLKAVGNSSLQIVDLTGRILISQPVQQGPGNLNVNIDELPNGSYVVRLFTNGNMYQSRMQVLR